MKILFVDTTHPLLPQLLIKEGFEVHENKCANKEECLKIIDKYEGIIIRSKFIIDKPFLTKATNLKFIGRVGAGMENIDVQEAERLGIKCFNSPEGNKNAVGEQALGMLLALQNNLVRAHCQVQKGKWLREENRGNELKNKVIGIVGFGNTGSAFAKKLQGMEMRILAYDKYKLNYAPDYVEETNMNQLFEECNIISFHVPLTKETQFLANKFFFQKFKNPIILINTSRGKVVNTSDLANAMKSGKVTGVCLDVLEYESTSFENLHKQKLPTSFEYITKSNRSVLSPHIAGWTHESNILLSTKLAEKIIAAFA